MKSRKAHLTDNPKNSSMDVRVFFAAPTWDGIMNLQGIRGEVLRTFIHEDHPKELVGESPIVP